jgi:hypothetical protein
MCGSVLEVRMMVSIDPLQCVGRHSKEPSRIPKIRSALHEPSRGRVPKRVRRHALKSRIFTGSPERLLDAGSDRLALPLDRVALSLLVPAAKMGEQSIRDLHWRPALLGFGLALGATMEHSAL